MKTVKIYGASDDLIEVIADGLTAEYDGYESIKYVGFDDGTVLKVQYSPDGYSGMWKIERVSAGTAQYTHEPAKNDEDDYSDVVTLRGEIASVCCGSSPTGGPDADEIAEFLVDFRWRDLSDEKLRKVYAIAKSK